MQKLYILLLLVFFVSSMGAQKSVYKKTILKANDFIELENYLEATNIYDTLLQEYPNDSYILFKAGECFLFSESRIKDAVEVLQKAVKSYPIKGKKTKQAIESRFYLAQAYHLNYNFQEALDVFENLKNKLANNKGDAISKIEREILYSKNAIILQNSPVDFTITNLGSLINTEFDEHSPVINVHEDLLLFTSKRGSGDTESAYSSFWRDGEWRAPKAIDFKTGSNGATIGLSPDGSTLLVYQNEAGVGNIYISQFRNDQWGSLEKLPAPINSLANETHASFSMDGNTLYFTSDRSGGFGGKDIYSVTKLPNGNWGKERNMGPGVNTDLDEESPYIHPNDNKLYFSSQGHQSMGGFDIFKAILDSADNWGKAQNIGYPINTPFDDLFYAPTIDEQRVYYVSRRQEGFGGTDIYMIEFPSDHPNALTVVGGFLYDQDGNPAANARIIVTDGEGEMKGIYRPSTINGKYIFIIASGEEYTMEISMKGYEEIIKDFTIPSGNSFVRRKNTFYLDPLIMKPN